MSSLPFSANAWLIAHTNFPSATALRWEGWRLCASHCGSDQVNVRFRENSSPVCAVQVRKKRSRHRSQGRRATPLDVRRFSPDQADRSTNRLQLTESPESFRGGESIEPRAHAH